MKAFAIALALAAAACGQGREPGVVLWHAYTGLERSALEATAAQWNAQHPEPPLTLVAVPHDSFADKLTSAIPRGNGPDLFIFADDRIGAWAESHTIEPIEFWVDDARADRFSTLAMTAMAYKGSLWGLPLATKSLVLFVRTDLVTTPPRTTNELVALGPRMRKQQGFAVAYANVDLYGHAPWLHGFGGKVIDDNGELAIATPEAANAMEFARKTVRAAPVYAAIGGFHLFAASDETLTWTAAKLKEFGVRYLMGAHCTGIEAVYRMRQLAGLGRQTAVVGAVGASYTHGKGFDATVLAR